MINLLLYKRLDHWGYRMSHNVSNTIKHIPSLWPWNIKICLHKEASNSGVVATGHLSIQCRTSIIYLEVVSDQHPPQDCPWIRCQSQHQFLTSTFKQTALKYDSHSLLAFKMFTLYEKHSSSLACYKGALPKTQMKAFIVQGMGDDLHSFQASLGTSALKNPHLSSFLDFVL